MYMVEPRAILHLFIMQLFITFFVCSIFVVQCNATFKRYFVSFVICTIFELQCSETLKWHCVSFDVCVNLWSNIIQLWKLHNLHVKR